MEFYQSVELRQGETVVREVPTYLTKPAIGAGKNGKLVLTNQLLLWTPIRLPFPRGEPVSLELPEISRCRNGGKRWLTGTIVVDARGESFEHLMAIPLLPPWRAADPDELVALIGSQLKATQ